ncbi:MAG: WecB/TagA/CpsF family glycosyltransferase, partial [Candidatus Dormibacteria bacterium]
MGVDPCTPEQALVRCARALDQGQAPLQVVTLNPEMVMQARRSPQLARAIREAGLVLADGAGVVWASRRLGRPLPARVTGVDFLDSLALLGDRTGKGLFLLGARPGVAEVAGRALQRRHPGLCLSGTLAGSPAPHMSREIAERVRGSGAAILAVAFGAPQQDLWLARHLESTGCRVGIGVGGTLDYLAGRVPRAPLALRRLGLEWLFRLFRQPWRLPRMARGAPFFYQVLRSRKEVGP